MNSFPSPQSLRQPGESMEGQTVVVRKKLQRVHIPAELDGIKGNHRYTQAYDESGNKINAYLPVEFDPADNQYPKMLYHPEYGKKAQPSIGDYARGASTNEMYQAALEMFQTAQADWEKGNRTIIASDKKREDELRKIGWLDYRELKHMSGAAKKIENDQL